MKADLRGPSSSSPLAQAQTWGGQSPLGLSRRSPVPWLSRGLRSVLRVPGLLFAFSSVAAAHKLPRPRWRNPAGFPSSLNPEVQAALLAGRCRRAAHPFQARGDPLLQLRAVARLVATSLQSLPLTRTFLVASKAPREAEVCPCSAPPGHLHKVPSSRRGHTHGPGQDLHPGAVTQPVTVPPTWSQRRGRFPEAQLQEPWARLRSGLTSPGPGLALQPARPFLLCALHSASAPAQPTAPWLVGLLPCACGGCC